MSTVRNTPWVLQFWTVKQSTGSKVWSGIYKYSTREEASSNLAWAVFACPEHQFRIKNELTGEII